MKLIYEKICDDNIVLASKIQYKIFPDSSAYEIYSKEIKTMLIYLLIF